ncbi:MAG: hypothetical protein KF729_25430 [Sandaracinaceae bacterium]|nr:hypothetical protein [Sandaracinaceae bacterium]
MRWLALALALSGCYGRHDRVYAPPDAGPSRFEGLWQVAQPDLAPVSASLYELAPDGRFVERCSTLGPVAVVERARDGRLCSLVGPWSSRAPDELAVEGFCDDSVRRTVVLAVDWGEDRPRAVTIEKVGGEEEGWSSGPFAWRWTPCAAAGADCGLCE